MYDMPIKEKISIDDFLKVDMRVGTIIEANDFPKAVKAAYKLKIDFGKLGIKKSSAQITKLYKKEDLIGKQVICVVNLPSKRIADYISECLLLGVIAKNGEIPVLTINTKTENGLTIG